LPDNHPLAAFEMKPVSHILNEAKSVCMQCSLCTEMCPRYLIGHKLRPNIVMRGMAAGSDTDRLSEALLCSECGICELFACPMHLSPRRVNIYVKKILREKGVGVADKQVHSEQAAPREYRRIAQKRIIGRLLPQGYPTEIDEMAVIEPKSVCVPLRHGVGRPSAPTVAVGDRVSAGDVIAEVGFSDVGCMVHAPVSGIVTGLDDGITIVREG